MRESDEYLRKHKILELFEDLTTIICYKQPENIEQFLVDLLKQRKEQGSRSIVYNEAELQNIFTLYDLKGAGHISRDQCKEGKLYFSHLRWCLVSSFSNIKQVLRPL